MKAAAIGYRVHRAGAQSFAPPPTGRGGAFRRCASPASPPPPPPPPGGGNGSGFTGGARGHGPESSGPGPSGQVDWWRLAAGVCAGAIATVGVAAAALPSVLSTQWGIQQFMQLANQWLPGRVEVAEAKLSWLGPNELQCVKVYDSPRGGTILLHLNKVTTSASLWSLLAGSDGFNLVIAKPWINAAYDPRLSDFKLLAWAEKAGLLGEPQPPPREIREQRRRQQQGQQQPAAAAQPPAPAAAKPAAPPPPPPGSLAAVLARVNAKMDFYADVRLGRAAVVVSDGMLLVPAEIRESLGPSLHLTGALGARELAEWASEVEEDVSWATGAAASPSSAAPAATATTAKAASSGAAAAVVSPPAEVLHRPSSYRPGIVQLHSEHLAAEMRLWHAVGGGASLLHQPATARLAVTPALSKLGFGSANPVLGDAVEARGGEKLQLSFMPEGGKLPYLAATAEMAPISLTLGANSLLPAALSELGLTRLSAAAAATGAAAAGGAASSPGGGLPVSVSRMVVDFSRDGELKTKRVDMRLGGDGAAGGGVRVALWGSADLLEDTTDFTLGVDPAPLLGRLGLSAEGLPEGYLLLLPLRGGAAAAPAYDVAAAARRLGQVVARQKAAQWAEGREQRREQHGEGARGLLAEGLHAVLSAVQPEEQIRSAVDRDLQTDCTRIPPPLSA